jgi:hypothetical protein
VVVGEGGGSCAHISMVRFTPSPPSSAASTPQDIKWVGSLQAYDEEVERMTSKTARKLRRFTDRSPIVTTAKDDTVLQELAGSGAGNVFATDAVLTHIMTAPRATIPWDVVVTVLPGGIVFLGANTWQRWGGGAGMQSLGGIASRSAASPSRRRARRQGL